MDELNSPQNQPPAANPSPASNPPPASPQSPAKSPETPPAQPIASYAGQQSNTPSALQTAFYAVGRPSPTLAAGSGESSVVAKQSLIDQGAYGAISESTLAPPVLSPQQMLAGKVGVIQAIADSTSASVGAALGGAGAQIGASAGYCAARVNEYFNGRLASIESECQGNYACLKSALTYLAGSAAEFAAQGGCNLADAQRIAQGLENRELSKFSIADQFRMAGGGSQFSLPPAADQSFAPAAVSNPPPLEPPMGAAGLGLVGLAAPSPASPAGAQPFCDPTIGMICPVPQGPLPPFNPGICASLPAVVPPPPPINPQTFVVPIDAPSQQALKAAYGGQVDCWPSAVVGQGAVQFNPNGIGQYFIPGPNGPEVVYGVAGPALQAWITLAHNICKCQQLAQQGGGGGGGGPGGGSGGNGSGGGGSGGGQQCPVCPKCQKQPCDCYDEQGNCKKTTPPKQWCVWQSNSDGTCYVRESTQPPADPADTKLGCYDNQTEANLLAEKCQKRQPPPPIQPPIEAGVVSTADMWCNPAICSEIDNMTASFEFVISGSNIMSVLFGERPFNDNDIEHSCDKWPFGTKWIGIGLYGFLYTLAGIVGYAVNLVRTGFECATPLAWSLAAWRCLLRWAGAVIGPGVGRFGQSAEYWQNYLCPQQIPSQDEVDAMLLADVIDTDQWRCYTRANNNCEAPRDLVVQSKRQREGVGELVALRRRGLIDQGEYNDRMRQLGFLYDFQWGDYWNLSEQIPPVSELIRMMVRDVADQGLVTKFGMDKHFTDKWQGQLKEWGYNQGIGDLFAQYEWRAHWSIPAPGQLYEMYHRLRKLDPADSAFVDLDTIKTALEQQDILPYWIDKFIKISFRPLTRIDAGRAYEVSAIDENRLEKAFTDLGYDDADAQTMVKFKKRQLGVRMRTLPPVSLYKKGLIPRSEAEQLLTIDGYDQTLIKNALDYAQILAQSASTAACVKSLKKRFMLGEVTAAQLAGNLTALNMDAAQANSTAAAWQCERAARGKLASVSILCKWFKAGLIDQAGYVTRLVNLGWGAAEIANHMQICQNEIDAEKLKQQLADQKAKEKAAKEALAQAAKLAKQQQQQAEKLARMALQEAKLTRGQFQRITEAAKYMVKAGVPDFTTAYNQVITAINTGMTLYQLDGQAAIDAAVKAAQSLTSKTWAEYPVLAEQAEKAEWLAFQTSVIDGSEVLGHG